MDSLLGAETVKSLNVPAQYSLAQIAANLERYRVSAELVRRTLHRRERGPRRLEAHDSRACSREDHRGRGVRREEDAVFAIHGDRVFRPYGKYAGHPGEETAPKIARIRVHGGERLEYFRPAATRHPAEAGAENSLGLASSVPEHLSTSTSTTSPEDALFDKDVRGFSHGCIRWRSRKEARGPGLGCRASERGDARGKATSP